MDDEWTLIGRMAIAAVLGFAIGFEREVRGKSAGERAFALISLGTSGMVAMGTISSADAESRIVQGVAAGIGFIGAGLIFRDTGGTVKGLTTAAAVWAVAAIGILCGAGYYDASVVATLAVLLILELESVLDLNRLDSNRGRQIEDEQGSKKG
jgi:putative Mg2+ transporter-C (MgtC) family protein